MNNNDLDAQVAEQVMEWHKRAWTGPRRVSWRREAWVDTHNKTMRMVDNWHPSTDWADAGRVLDHTQMLLRWELRQHPAHDWEVVDNGERIAVGTIGPEAISHAALVWAQEHKT